MWVGEVTLAADWPDGSLAVGANRENCHINLSALPSLLTCLEAFRVHSGRHVRKLDCLSHQVSENPSSRKPDKSWAEETKRL